MFWQSNFYIFSISTEVFRYVSGKRDLCTTYKNYRLYKTAVHIIIAKDMVNNTV